MAQPAPDIRNQRIIELLDKLAPGEGYTLSKLDTVRFMRANHPLGRTPVLYEPGIIIVCQGSKRGYLGSEVYLYDANHYLVLSVPLPFSTETEATPENPLLAVAIRLDMSSIVDLVFRLDQAGGISRSAPKGIISTPLSGAMIDATLRLLEALASPLETQILAPAIVSELCYRVLVGEQGGAIRAALAQNGQFGRIAGALRRIHSDYATPLDVATLAKEACISIPAFHVHFKAVTRTSPIQYIKATRLHQARLMMIRDNMTAAGAAAKVGYESPSQFNREFKRLFGRSPGEETRDMKTAFSLLPAADLAGMAMKH